MKYEIKINKVKDIFEEIDILEHLLKEGMTREMSTSIYYKKLRKIRIMLNTALKKIKNKK